MKSLKAVWQAIPYKALLFGPTAFVYIGAALNQIVMIANGALMPVLMPGGCPDDAENGLLDPIHSCMTQATHLKFLADIFNLHIMIASLGDMFLFLGDVLTWPAIFVAIGLILRERMNDSSVLRQQ